VPRNGSASLDWRLKTGIELIVRIVSTDHRPRGVGRLFEISGHKGGRTQYRKVAAAFPAVVYTFVGLVGLG